MYITNSTGPRGRALVMKKILVPLPAYGFDPTETAIPWSILSENKFQVFFATPGGTKAKGDTLMLTGKKLGVWKGLLRARLDAVAAYFMTNC